MVEQDPFQEFGGQLIKRDAFQEFGGQQTDPPIAKVPAKQFFADYMSSPAYKQKLSNFNITDNPNVKDVLNANISQVKGVPSLSYNTNSSNNTDTNHAGFPIIHGRPNINIDRSEQNVKDTKLRYGATEYADDTLSHELSHISRKISPEEENLIASLNKKPDEATAYNEYKKLNLSDPFSHFLNVAYNGAHDAKPNEIKADLDAFRYSMWKKGIYDTSKRDMTIDDYKKASQDKEIKTSLEFKRLIDRFKPSDLILLNNKIAMNKNINPNRNLLS